MVVLGESHLLERSQANILRCSSLDGLLQENGPFLWQSGTYAPQPNPFSWTNLTNMVYVDQPIGE